MAIIFSQSKAYREEYDLEKIYNLNEENCWLIFKEFRWSGDIFKCPRCECLDKHYFIVTRKQWTCRDVGCGYRFSVTSKTPFQNRNISFKKLLLLVNYFIVSPQGISANSLHAFLKTTLRTTYLNICKIREVLHETRYIAPLQGVVHIDCAYFSGKPRRANNRAKTDSYVINNKLRNRKDAIVPDLKTHPEPWNLDKLQNRRVVLAIAQINPTDDKKHNSERTICEVIMHEKSSIIIPIIAKYVHQDATIMTDCGNAFNVIRNDLGNEHLKVNHSLQYMTADDVSNNAAERFFSRMRRAEFGTYNGMRHQYFELYVSEFVWRNDYRKLTLQQKYEDVMSRIFKCTLTRFHKYGQYQNKNLEDFPF